MEGYLAPKLVRMSLFAYLFSYFAYSTFYTIRPCRRETNFIYAPFFRPYNKGRRRRVRFNEASNHAVGINEKCIPVFLGKQILGAITRAITLVK